MAAKKIILASASPRRRELLERLGLEFVVKVPSYDEEDLLNLPPYEYVEKSSLGKAKALVEAGGGLIISADTIGIYKGAIIGKPNGSSSAFNMLKMLSGKTHEVVTAFTILDSTTGKSVTQAVSTKVYIRKITDEEINSYVKSGEPLDKAGAYAIQGLGALFVEKIEGDYYNVVGLPLSALAQALKGFGVNVLEAE